MSPARTPVQLGKARVKGWDRVFGHLFVSFPGKRQGVDQFNTQQSSGQTNPAVKRHRASPEFDVGVFAELVSWATADDSAHTTLNGETDEQDE